MKRKGSKLQAEEWHPEVSGSENGVLHVRKSVEKLRHKLQRLTAEEAQEESQRQWGSFVCRPVKLDVILRPGAP